MPLPRLIEYIESIIRPGGGYISEHGGGQVIVPVYPPGLTINTNITPLANTYALICYRVSFGVDMIPSAFNGVIQHAGRHRYNGVLSSTVIRDGLDFFLVITDKKPLMVSTTNNSALAQYFEEIHQFCVVNSHEDYDLIIEALKDLSSDGWTDAQQALVSMGVRK